MPYKDTTKQREYQKTWIAERRRKWFADKVCVDCGTRKNLTLDHCNPKEKVDHRIWSWSDERREAELKKCVVRCWKHHVEKTWDYDRQRTTHGKAAMYQRHGCRCTLCREWKRRDDAMRRPRVAE